MLAEAESLFLSEQPIIPLVTSTTNWLKKPYVKGMFANPLTLHPWKFVRIERDPQLWDDAKKEATVPDKLAPLEPPPSESSLSFP